MVLKLISATPSPYARKIRIQLLEKGIPFELKTEVPWDKTTETPQYNPLEKLPVLIFDDDDDNKNQGREPIYESHYIMEYVEQKFEPLRSLTPPDIDTALKAKQLEVLADSICDALVLTFFERQRGKDHQSNEWLDRQRRKIEGGLKALERHVASRSGSGSEFALSFYPSTSAVPKNESGNKNKNENKDRTQNRLSIADVAIVSMVDFLRLNEDSSIDKCPALLDYADRLNRSRTSFKDTMPFMFEIKDKIV